MTASDQLARPPDAPPDGPEWKKLPGARDYESSHRGKVRSLPRTKNGRAYPGTYPEPMKLREDGDGYLVFNYTDDDGVRHTNASVARVTLMTHDPAWRPWLQACHGPGGQKDNRFPENIRTDTPDANRQEALETRLANNPPKPKPPKVCPRCGAEHAEKGRNCRACFEGIGVQGARLLADGNRPEKVAEQLDYPLAGVLNLAVRYGGLRFVTEDELNAMLRDAAHAESPKRRLRRVLFRREASRQNSDGG